MCQDPDDSIIVKSTNLALWNRWCLIQHARILNGYYLPKRGRGKLNEGGATIHRALCHMQGNLRGV